jgi:hypothetical protein
MFVKGIYVVILSLLMVSPVVVYAEEESAEEIEAIMSWWNEYGRYWEAAETAATEETVSVTLSENSE